jgi:hypothetical protein
MLIAISIDLPTPSISSNPQFSSHNFQQATSSTAPPFYILSGGPTPIRLSPVIVPYNQIHVPPGVKKMASQSSRVNLSRLKTSMNTTMVSSPLPSTPARPARVIKDSKSRPLPWRSFRTPFLRHPTAPCHPHGAPPPDPRRHADASKHDDDPIHSAWDTFQKFLGF